MNIPQSPENVAAAEAAAERAAIQGEGADGHIAEALQFLRRLDPERDEFTFQTFDDSKAKDDGLARVIHGTLDSVAPKLDRLQKKHAGAFVTINITDGNGRQAHNVTAVRAVFVDLDRAPLAPVLAAGLEPHIVVESSAGRYHAYWLVDDCPLDQFEVVQRALATRFGGDTSVHDLPRVMRLPGYTHYKGEPQTTKIIPDLGTSGPPYHLAEIVAKLGLKLGGSANGADGVPHIAPTTSDELRRVILEGIPTQVYPALVSLSARLIGGKHMDEADATAVLRCLLYDCKWRERDAETWQARFDEVPELVRSAIEKYRKPGNDDAPAPLDILRPMVAPPLLADDVPDVLAQFARAYSQATGFDVSIMLLGGIVTAAAMIADQVRLCVSSRSGWFESARLWGVVIGGPGAGKSPALKEMQQPLFALHRELLAQWSATKARPKQDDGLNEPAEEIPQPCLFTSDATTEALTDVLRDNERGILYTVDELSSWLESHDAYRAKGSGKDRGEWLRLYDGGPHQVNRVQRGAFFVPNWGASLLSATTPAQLRKLAPKLPDDGLLQRLLLVNVQPRAFPDTTMLRLETKAPTEAWDAALRRLYALPPEIIYLCAEAHTIFDQEQAELHRLTLAFEDAHPSYAAHLAKRAAMLARLALVFHALEAPAVGKLSGETMQRAARFLRRQERHAMAVYGSMFGSGTGMQLAQAIARSILASKLQSFNRRELTPACKAFRHADKWTREAALTLLCDCGWLTTDIATVTHGASWAVDPRVHALFAEYGETARQRRKIVRDRITGLAADEDEDD